MVLTPLALEPDWGGLQIGQSFDCMLETILHGVDKPLCRSSLTRQLVVVLGELPVADAYSCFGATLQSNHQGIRISIQDAVILEHRTPSTQDFYQVIEGCSGIGCLGKGMESSGFTVRVSCDQSQPICAFMEAQGHEGVVHGNLKDPQTHRKCQGPFTLAGGFSCQPWSQLGDGLRTNDGRAGSLIFLLRCAYFLRAHSVVLECVTNAGRDVEVRKVLNEFCRITSFSRTELSMSLSDILPARRDRWWCVLHSNMFEPLQLRPIPKFQVPPVMGDMLPVNLIWPIPDMQQLELDLYESGKFEDYGGLLAQLVDPNACLRTALHGWSVQLTGCPCGCRTHPFSESRLQQRGLYGALMLIGGEFVTGRRNLAKTRHLHPAELAMVHGMSPAMQWGPNLRFSISCLGQLASPVQSCWISAQLKQHVDGILGHPVVTPEQALADHFCNLFQDVKQVMPAVAGHPRFVQFAHQLIGLLKASNQMHVIPQPFPVDQHVAGQSDPRSPEPNAMLHPPQGVESPSHDARKFSVACTQIDANEDDLEPAEPSTFAIDDVGHKNLRNSQRSGREDLLKQPTVIKQPAEEPQVLQVGGPVSVSQCTQSPVHAMPAPVGPSLADPSHASSKFQANPQHGGIPAFANEAVVALPPNHGAFMHASPHEVDLPGEFTQAMAAQADLFEKQLHLRPEQVTHPGQVFAPDDPGAEAILPTGDQAVEVPKVVEDILSPDIEGSQNEPPPQFGGVETWQNLSHRSDHPTWRLCARLDSG